MRNFQHVFLAVFVAMVLISAPAVVAEPSEAPSPSLVEAFPDLQEPIMSVPQEEWAQIQDVQAFVTDGYCCSDVSCCQPLSANTCFSQSGIVFGSAAFCASYCPCNN